MEPSSLCLEPPNHYGDVPRRIRSADHSDPCRTIQTAAFARPPSQWTLEGEVGPVGVDGYGSGCVRNRVHRRGFRYMNPPNCAAPAGLGAQCGEQGANLDLRPGETVVEIR